MATINNFTVLVSYNYFCFCFQAMLEINNCFHYNVHVYTEDISHIHKSDIIAL